MVGGTSFHREILNAGLGGMSKSNGNSNSKILQEGKVKTFAAARVS
jgi:hypothetical protein